MKIAGIFFAGLCCLAGGSKAQDKAPVAVPTQQPVAQERVGQELRFVPQKLALKVPLGWQTLPVASRQAGTLVSLAPLGTTGATLALSYANDPNRERLPENLPATIAAALSKRYPGFQQTAKQHLTLSGADAWLLDGQVRNVGQGFVVKNRQVYILHDGRIYIFTLTCKKEDFEHLAPSLDRILKSIAWLD
jgi:hypothetical protein